MRQINQCMNKVGILLGVLGLCLVLALIGCNSEPKAPTPTPTLAPEWAFSNLATDGSTVVVELRVFAGIDVRVTLDGQQPDEVTIKGNILRHVFKRVGPGKHSVTASDVMGFSDSREIVVDP